MGGRIVWHSFRLLFINLGSALKVSVGPYLLGIAACLAVLGAAGVPVTALLPGGMGPEGMATGAMGPEMMERAGGFMAAALVCALILIFVSGWVAVAWHRFVLLEEYPGLLPAVAGRPVWPYVWRVVLLSLVLLLAAIPLGMVLGMVVVPFAHGGGRTGVVAAMLVMGIVTGAILSFLWMRLGLILPAVAVDRPMTMGDSWGRTAPYSGAIFGAVLIVIALNIGAGVLFGLVLGPGVFVQVLSTVVDWISIMVGISLLTTLYGVIVERRALD